MADELNLGDLPEPEHQGTIAVDELGVDGENPNEMTAANFDLLKKRIRERGWVGGEIIANAGDLPDYEGGDADGSTVDAHGVGVPVAPADDPDGLVADGEHRLRAARALGLEEVPVILIDFEDDAERRLWRQEMNKNRGEHDPEQDRRDIHAILGSDSEDDLMELMEAKGESLGDLLDDDGAMGDGDPEIETPEGDIEGPEAQHDFLVATLEVGIDDWEDVRPELEDLADDYEIEMEVA